MPVRNEVDFIDESLGAVLAQDYPGRMEVLVADGMSTDGTRERIAAATGRDSRVRLIDNESRIVAPGLNRAVTQASGDVVVRVDGHCVIAPDYVRRCVAHLTAGEADGVGGSVETVGKGRVARAIALAMSSRFGVGDSAFRTLKNETRLVDTVPFPAYSREIMRRAGPFDEELVRNQDDEYNTRVRARGGRILLAADVRSTYHSRPSFKSLWRQYFQYGYWKVRVFQKHPTQMRWRHFVPSLFVAGLATSAVLAGASWRPAGVLGAAGLVLYAGASAVATRRATAKERLGLALDVLWSFWILHFAYGLGFLWGLIRFAGRWRDRGVVAASEGTMTPRRVV
jgi:glycosyltransferase involved in cell wall biosynthesis